MDVVGFTGRAADLRCLDEMPAPAAGDETAPQAVVITLIVVSIDICKSWS
jgi:hypothetical protein